MTLHHSIANRLDARLLLARQWSERISFECAQLKQDIIDAYFAQDILACERAAHDHRRWCKRLLEDLDRTRKRLREDGYELLRNHASMPVIQALPDLPDVAFVPCVYFDGDATGGYEVWTRGRS